MANTLVLLVLLVFSSIYFPILSKALSSCNGPCRTFDDCAGQLICINRKCNDDPNLGTHICRGSTPSPHAGNSCQTSGTLTCEGGGRYPTYTCSPPVTSSTAAKLTLNNFEKAGNGGGPWECDDQYHDNSDLIVALSTGWYNGESRCGNIIMITAGNGRSVRAKVVEDCDSLRRCHDEQAGEPSCENNIVYASDAVWNALDLDKELGVVDITWAMA